jgi:hypothetical protein
MSWWWQMMNFRDGKQLIAAARWNFTTGLCATP